MSESVQSTETAAPASSPEAPRPTRFAWGISLGVGIGAIAVIAILALVWFAMSYSVMHRYGASGGSSSVKVSTVEAGTWFTVGADGRGTVRGYSNSWGSGDDMIKGTFAYIDLVAPGSMSGVLITHSVPIYIRNDTKLTVGGKDWRPNKKSADSPAQTAFGDSYEGESPLDSRELTVAFHLVGKKLVADSIDASGTMVYGSFPWEE